MSEARWAITSVPVTDDDLPDGPPSELERLWGTFGQPLLHQQFWCWGWDIRRPTGNLLVERGFARSRPPGPIDGSSAYLLRGDGYRVVLWGFGIHYARRGIGSVFLGRYASLPLISPVDRPPTDVWLPGELPPMRRMHGPGAGAEVLLPGLLRWIAGYERWVRRTAGEAHREGAVATWGDRSVVPAWRMPGAWAQLGREVRRCLEAGAPHD